MIAELIGGRALFRAMGGTGDALAIASMYAAILFGGAPLFWLFNILASILRGAGVMVLPAAVSIAGAVVTLTISPALIVGLGPIPKLGVPGAACAMLGFYAAASIVLGGVLLFGQAPVRLRPTVRVQWSMLGDILRVGLPGAVITLLTNTTVLLLTGLVGPFGTKAIAGYGMGARLEYIQISIVFGLGTALVTMVGTNFGAGNVRRAERVAWTGAAFAGCLTGTIGMIFAVDPHLWLDTFSKDPAVFDAGMRYLRIVAPAYGIYGAGLALYFSSLGTGRVLWAVASSILRLVGCRRSEDRSRCAFSAADWTASTWRWRPVWSCSLAEPRCRSRSAPGAVAERISRLMRGVPIVGGVRLDLQRHRQRHRRQRRVFHHFLDHRQRLFDFRVRHLEDQFVVHLQQHLRGELVLRQRAFHADHGAADDVGGAALQPRVDRGALVEGADRGVGRADIRIVALAAEQRRPRSRSPWRTLWISSM